MDPTNNLHFGIGQQVVILVITHVLAICWTERYVVWQSSYIYTHGVIK